MTATLWSRLGLLCFCALVILVSSVITGWPDSRVHLIFCDVGQGDAVLITQNFSQILYDGGPDSRVKECLANNLPWWDNTIDLIIASHADRDHYGGLQAVLETYQTKEIWLPILAKKTDDFGLFYEAVLREKKQGTRVGIPTRGEHLALTPKNHGWVISPLEEDKPHQTQSGVTTETYLSVVGLEGEVTDDTYNQLSTALFFDLDGVTLLLTGDMTTASELALNDRGMTMKADILKVAHHGAKTSSSLSFLQRVQPEISVISSGQNNTYGHPTPEVISSLEEIGTKILRTDRKGEIDVVIEDGQYWLAEP